MQFKIAFEITAIIAYFTLPGFSILMDDLMLFHGAFGLGFIITKFATKWPFSSMPLHMNIIKSRLSKSLRTQRTLVRSLSGVNS